MISYLLPAKHDRQDVENKHTLGYTVIGEAMKFGPNEIPAKPEDFEFAKKYLQPTVSWHAIRADVVPRFIDISSKLLASAQIAVHPPKVGKGGLQGVLEGLDDLKEGKVSGVKLVYRVGETS